MIAALQAFARHSMIERLEEESFTDPWKPKYTTVKITGALNISDFAMAVNLELEKPGAMGGGS